MNSPTLLFLTSLIGLIPSVLLLYYVLRTYDDYFKDSTLYIFFAVGMILGMVSFVLHALIDQQVLEFLDLGILIFVLAFAAFEILQKYVIFYLKWFRGQHATTYYGVAFGLGFGATSIISLVYQDVYRSPEDFLANPVFLPTAVLLSLGYIGLHSTTGGLIGYGSAKKIRWGMLILAFITHLTFNFILYWFARSWYPSRIGIALILAGIGIGGIYYFRRDFMPLSLSPPQARERRRKMKAEIRKARLRREKGLPPEKGPGMPTITFGERPPLKKKTEEE